MTSCYSSYNKFQVNIVRYQHAKQFRKFKNAYLYLPKNDNVDAFVITDYLRFGRIASEVHMGGYRYSSLQTLTRARFDAVLNLTREKQFFTNYPLLKCFGLVQNNDMPNTKATTLALMEAFEFVDELAICDLETLTAFVTAAGHGRFADPEATAKAVQTALRDFYMLHKAVNGSVNQTMSVSAASMQALESQIKVLERALLKKSSKQDLGWCALFFQRCPDRNTNY